MSTGLDSGSIPPRRGLMCGGRGAAGRCHGCRRGGAAEGRADMSVFGTYNAHGAGFPQTGLLGRRPRARPRCLPLCCRRRPRHAAGDESQSGGRPIARCRTGRGTGVARGGRLSSEAQMGAAAASDRRARAAVQVYREGLQPLADRSLDGRAELRTGRLTLLDVLAERRRYLELEHRLLADARAAYEARTSLVRPEESPHDEPYHEHRPSRAAAASLGLLLMRCGWTLAWLRWPAGPSHTRGDEPRPEGTDPRAPRVSRPLAADRGWRRSRHAVAWKPSHALGSSCRPSGSGSEALSLRVPGVVEANHYRQASSRHWQTVA